MRRHPHRKGRKRQRKKREHGTQRQRRWKPFRSKWAAMSCDRGISSGTATVRSYVRLDGSLAYYCVSIERVTL